MYKNVSKFLRHFRKHLFRGTQITVLIGILVVSLVGVSVPQTAHASDNTCGWFGLLCDTLGNIAGALSGPLKTIGDMAGAVGIGILGFFVGLLDILATWLVSIAGSFLTFIVVDVNSNIQFFTNSMVIAGWQVVRDIANWFFIIALIIIAVGTIIGQEQFGVKRNLPRLILVALFLNFSLFLTGLFINVCNLFTSFFVTQMTDPTKGGYANIGAVIAEQGFGVVSGTLTGYNPTPPDALTAVAAQFFGTLFKFIAAYVMLMLAIALLVRVAHLWFFMIISPLAFVSSLIPRAQKYFEQWLNGLIKWGTFSIGVVFFLWLSTYLIEFLTNPATAPGYGQTLLSDVNGFPLMQVATLLLRFVTLTMFLGFGLTLSKEMSGKVGTLASGAVLGATGMAVALPLAAGASVARGGRRIASREIEDRTYAARERAGRILERIPLVGGAVSAPVRGGLRGEEVRVKQKLADMEKGLASGGPKAIQSLAARLASSGLTMDRAERAATLIALSKRNALNDEMKEKYYEGAFKYLQARGTEGTIAGVDQERARKLLGGISADELVEKYKLHLPMNAPFLPASSFEKDPSFRDAILKRISGNALQEMSSTNPMSFGALISSINKLDETELKNVSSNQALMKFLATSPAAMGAGIESERIQNTLEKIRGEENREA